MKLLFFVVMCKSGLSMERYIDILSHFPILNEVESVETFGSGHINDTFKVKVDDTQYILQRVNHHVFKNVKGLTDNIIKVTAYISKHLRDTDMQTLQFFPTFEGEFIVQDASGDYWRLMQFVEGSKVFDLVDNKSVAFSGGKAYGWFVKMLKDFTAETLIDTIPDFHNIDFRLSNFRQAVRKDKVGRLKEVTLEVDFVEKRAEEMRKILLAGEAGEIPLRVTHNDTKISNVLFNEKDEAICVIDLDTVMPGYVLYDFGDAIRTFTNTAKEDEKDLSKVTINMDYYKAFAQGFLSETQDILSPKELELLPFSARFMAYIMGLRFLTDYLDGDPYYKVEYTGHNLVRAKGQFRLLEEMEKNELNMRI